MHALAVYCPWRFWWEGCFFVLVLFVFFLCWWLLAFGGWLFLRSYFDLFDLLHLWWRRLILLRLYGNPFDSGLGVLDPLRSSSGFRLW